MNATVLTVTTATKSTTTGMRHRRSIRSSPARRLIICLHTVTAHGCDRFVHRIISTRYVPLNISGNPLKRYPVVLAIDLVGVFLSRLPAIDLVALISMRLEANSQAF
jgi:hypothetical protein